MSISLRVLCVSTGPFCVECAAAFGAFGPIRQAPKCGDLIDDTIPSFVFAFLRSCSPAERRTETCVSAAYGFYVFHRGERSGEWRPGRGGGIALFFGGLGSAMGAGGCRRRGDSSQRQRGLRAAGHRFAAAGAPG